MLFIVKNNIQCGVHQLSASAWSVLFWRLDPMRDIVEKVFVGEVVWC